MYGILQASIGIHFVRYYIHILCRFQQNPRMFWQSVLEYGWCEHAFNANEPNPSNLQSVAIQATYEIESKI